MLVTILLIVLLMLTAGLLAVAKRGFNEVIKGLESLDDFIEAALGYGEEPCCEHQEDYKQDCHKHWPPSDDDDKLAERARPLPL